MRPLAIDLFCGLGGWTEGLLAEGYEVIGFDITQHVYREHRYPAQLVLQDVLTLHGRQFKDAALIVASPPCQEYSYMAMPWSRAKAIAAEYRNGTRNVADLTRLFEACFRLQREACEAAARHIPMVVENVRGAQAWVGRSRWNYGSFHLWGDVPALMPVTLGRQALKQGVTHRANGATNFHAYGATETAGVKRPGMNWSGSNKPGYVARAFNDMRHIGNLAEHIKCGGDWCNGASPSDMRHHSSRSTARKQASAQIAKIPVTLSRHIARVYHP